MKEEILYVKVGKNDAVTPFHRFPDWLAFLSFVILASLFLKGRLYGK